MRLARLMTRSADAVREGRCTMEAATRFVDWLETAAAARKLSGAAGRAA